MNKAKTNKKKVIARKIQKSPRTKSEETMDRKALKVVVSHLKDAGVDIKVLKNETDDVLMKKVNSAIQKLPQGDVLRQLETVVPEKLVTVLKRDCLGVFIDLGDVSCVRCPDNVACVRAFLKGVRGGFADLALALPDKDAGPKPAAKKKLPPVSRYEATRLVFVRDVPNPNPRGDAYHDTFQAVLDEQPSSMAELREIVERDFTIDSDADFMNFVTSMRDLKEGLIKLDVDLSDKDKTQLREAGYDV